MLSFLARTLHSLFDWFDGLKGPRAVITHHEEVSPGMCFSVATTGGFEFKIYCKQLKYAVHYQRYGYKSKVPVIYEVRCECDEFTPREIRQRLSHRFVIPETCSPWVSRERRKQAAINVFLSMVIDQLATTPSQH